MRKIETAQQLAQACREVAQKHSTVYVLGCWGAPMTPENKSRWSKAQSFNRKSARKKALDGADKNTFGFDCGGLIKGLLWGWQADPEQNYAGAGYAVNGVPDLNADQIINACSQVSRDFSHIQIGEAVWLSGHIGVYVGDGLVAECTYRWQDGVQLTALHNLAKQAGINGRKWTSHGKLPWISYADTAQPEPAAQTRPEPAASFTRSYAGQYRVASAIGLKLRTGAGTNKPILETMANGSQVRCYGYHTGSWLYVVSATGKEGFCHKSLLKKK